MPDPRYITTGLPPEASAGHTAFMPHFNRLAASGAQMFKDGVSGFPGTKKIPLSARVNSVPSPDLGDIVQMGLSRSSDAPDAFWPNLYYALPERQYYPGASMPIQIYDPVAPEMTTMIPVPAVSLRTLYLKHSARLATVIDPGGQQPMPNPAGRFANKWKRRLKGNKWPEDG